MKPYKEKCLSCSYRNGCEDCYFENETEYCTKCYSGYFLRDGNCSKCSDSRCSSCFFEDGKEYCRYCSEEGYMPYEN